MVSAFNPYPVQGTMTAQPAGDAITVGGVTLTPKYAKIDAASSGNNSIVSAVTSKKIRVLSLFLVVTSAVTVKFASDTATPVDKTGAMPFGANGGIALPFNQAGWFETAAGKALNMILGTGVQVSGALSYVEV